LSGQLPSANSTRGIPEAFYISIIKEKKEDERKKEERNKTKTNSDGDMKISR
jgi:hypothetical protein